MYDQQSSISCGASVTTSVGAVEPPPGVWSTSSDVDAVPAAAAASAQKTNEQARVQVEVARRYAYSQLDQMARRTIAATEWCWASSPNDCVDILEAFQKYQDSNEWAPKPLNVKAVVAEIRLTVQYFSQKRLWPFWVLQPTDRLVRRIPEDDDADEDYGNENWEVLVNVCLLSRSIQCSFQRRIRGSREQIQCWKLQLQRQCRGAFADVSIETKKEGTS